MNMSVKLEARAGNRCPVATTEASSYTRSSCWFADPTSGLPPRVIFHHRAKIP
jgi:hypothetical protein